MTRTNDILESQVIYVKRGRFNDFGFEPAWNAYYDFYANTKYTEKPILDIEDIGFHLFLRKNLNDRNPNWKMPTIRQIKKRFGMGQPRIEAIMKRLERAHLLTKESGVTGGRVQHNSYILSDPIQTLDEFLEVASYGVFGVPLRPEYQRNGIDAPSNQDALVDVEVKCTQIEYINGNSKTNAPETSTLNEPDLGTPQQTYLKQTWQDDTWRKALEELKSCLPEKAYNTYLAGTKLVAIEDGTATISTNQSFSVTMIENRLCDKICRALEVERVRCVVVSEEG